jgi:hypothetical protein
MSASFRAPRRPALRFEVQTRFYGDSWENCWTDDGEPSRYPSHRAAEDALDLYLREIEQAVVDGDMFEAYDRDDFRIVAVRP